MVNNKIGAQFENAATQDFGDACKAKTSYSVSYLYYFARKT